MTEPRRPVDPPSPAPRSGRPSLTGGDDAAKSGQSVSVLSAVTPPSQPVRGPVPRGVSAALPWIGVVTLAIIGIIFWMELSGPSAPPAAPTTPPPVTLAPPAPTAAEIGSTTPPPATVSEPASSAATIETERPVVAAAPAEATKKPAPAAPEAPPKPAAPTKLAAAAPAPLPAAPAPAASEHSPFAAIDKPAAAPATAVSPARKKPGGAGDRDTDLVAALLSRSPTGAPVAPVAKPVEPAPALRDVVERDPVISTDKLLKRCESLGVLEAELCKARICSGLWGKDSSCPARPPAAQPASASAATAAQTGN